MRDLDADSNNLPDVLTIDEMAKLMRLNRNTIYEAFRRGEIPGGRRVGQRIIRFSKSVVLDWLATGNDPNSHH